MKFRMSTSKRTEEIFEYLQQRTYLQPYALSKLSIALALNSGFSVKKQDMITDSNGLELNRQTITGENDHLFKSLIELQEGIHLQDDDYFPDYVKKYVDYGAMLLEQEYKYDNDIYTHLVNLEKGI